MKNFKSIISSSIGNILEWYDFGLFAIYSPLFSHLFFPAKDPHIALLEALGIFAIGFLCRPIGALLFGYLGDTQGRVKTLRLSILMISIPTLLIGCIPTYSSIGITAPILLLIIRIWQGISLGGEYSGNLIYLAETAPANSRAFITAFAGTGANVGILLATIIGGITTFSFSETTFQAWGWRLPYIISGIFCLIIYATRLQFQETHIFNYFKDKKLITHNPINVMIKTNLPHVLRTLGLVCSGSVFYYFCFIYLPIFLDNALKFTLLKTTTLMSIFISSMIFLVPLSGLLCDKIGRRKLLLFNAAAIGLIVIPCLSLLLKGYAIAALIALTLFTLISSLEQATTSVSVVENYPMPARYTGLSFGYNLGNGIFGGTIPFISQWLIFHTHSQLAPGIYIMLCSAITFFVALFCVKETKGKSLL
jgi:MHS family proline/betaine transporter-like MFS transporter